MATPAAYANVAQFGAEVYMSRDGGTFKKATEPNASVFQSTWIPKAGRSYQIKIRAKHNTTDFGRSEWSNTVTVPIPPTGGPFNMTAVAGNDGTIRLNWLDGSDNETSFKIERTADPYLQTGFTTISVPEDSREYIDYESRSTAAAGTGVYYRISAVNQAGEFGYAYASAAIPPAPTVTITAADPTAGETSPGDPNTPNPARFVVRRTGGAGNPLTVSLPTPAGTATEGDDYDALPRSVTIPAGASAVVVTLTPKNDEKLELSETATLVAENNVRHKYTQAQPASVTIVDDETIDLDIDSDNQDGFTPPANNPAEDVLEADSTTGKIIGTNGGDSDADGKPAYADFNGISNAEGDAVVNFVPVVVRLPEIPTGSSDSFKFTYSGPTVQQLNSQRLGDGTAEDPYVYSPAGRLRIWKKDGFDSRSVASDYIVPGQSYTRTQLGIAAGVTTATFYVEAANGSSAFEQIKLDTTVSNAAGSRTVSDFVYAGPIGWHLQYIKPDGSFEDVTSIIPSHPAPEFDDTAITVTNLRYSEDDTKIVGDIVITSTLDSVVADITPGELGTIDSAVLIVNDDSSQTYTVSVTATKAAQTESLINPFDYSGTINQTITGVQLSPGWNTFELLASDKVSKLTGFVDTSAEVIVTPLEDALYDFDFNRSENSSTQVSVLVITVAKNGTALGTATLAETPADSEVFVGSFLGAPIEVKLNQNGAGTATVTSQKLELDSRQVVVVDQVGNDANHLTGKALVTDDDRQSYKNFVPPVAGELKILSASHDPVLNSYLVKFDGPVTLLQELQGKNTPLTLTGASETLSAIPIKVGNDFVLGLPGEYGGMPRTLQFFALPPLNAFNPSDIGLVNPLEVGLDAFLRGVEDGFAEAGWDFWAGVEKIGSFIGNVLASSPPPGQMMAVSGMSDGQRDQLFKSIQTARVAVRNDVNDFVKSIKEIGKLLWAVSTGVRERIDNLIIGDEEVAQRLSAENQLVVDVVSELIDHVMTSSDYQRGKIAGRIGFETLSFIIQTFSGEIAVGALTKFGLLKKLKTAGKLTGEGAAALERATADMVEGLATKMCFVAGTPIVTANGLVPIEQIRPGTLVLSRDENTGLQTFKPVLSTVTTHPDALYTVRYDVDGAGPVPSAEVITTAPHPFYVLGKGFVSASELGPGDHLSLADGSAADVVSLRAEHATGGNSFTTYNFEVADFHTYFVNSDGVWVHNSSLGKLCEKAFSLYRQHRHYGEAPEQAFEKAQLYLSKHVAKGSIDESEWWTHIGDVLDEVIKKDVWPATGDFWSPGQAGHGGKNAYFHFMEHVINNKSGIPGGEFPDISDAVTYVKRAREFLDTSGPNVITWTAGTKRYVFNKADNLFAVEEEIQAGSSKVINTFFKSNLKDKPGNLLSQFEWVKRRGYAGPAF